jgi:hypothetical protein
MDFWNGVWRDQLSAFWWKYFNMTVVYLDILWSSRNEDGAFSPSCKVSTSCMCVVLIPHSCNMCTLTK